MYSADRIDNPLIGKHVLISPHRTKRPWNVSRAEGAGRNGGLESTDWTGLDYPHGVTFVELAS